MLHCIVSASETGELDTAFSSLADVVSDLTLKGIADMGFTHMTEIQAGAIRPLLDGRYNVSISEGVGGGDAVQATNLCLGLLLFHSFITSGVE